MATSQISNREKIAYFIMILNNYFCRRHTQTSADSFAWATMTLWPAKDTDAEGYRTYEIDFRVL